MDNAPPILYHERLKPSSRRTYFRAYYLANLDGLREKSRARYLANPKAAGGENPVTKGLMSPEEWASYCWMYRAANKERVCNIERRSSKKGYQKERLDIGFRILCSLRGRLYELIRRVSSYKSVRTIELLGCSLIELRQHIESLFMDGMTWSNYGQWEIDHKKPCSLFDLTNLEEQKKCFHFSNLQPLWAVENRRKTNRYEHH